MDRKKVVYAGLEFADTDDTAAESTLKCKVSC